MKEFRILLIGGGSGGHAYPLVAVAQSLREKASVAGISLNLMIMGEGGFIKKAAEENKIPFKIILAGKLRRYPSFQSIFDFLKMPIGFIQSLWYIFWFMLTICIKSNHIISSGSKSLSYSLFKGFGIT